MKDYLRQYLAEDKIASSIEEVRFHVAATNQPNFTEMRHDDMTGAIEVQAEDGLWYGVKGMKWGVITGGKSGGGGKKDGDKSGGGGMTSSPGMTSSGKSSKKSDEDDKPKKDPGAANRDQPTGESSVMRYARVSQAARDGKAASLSDEDIAFLRARTKAIDEVNQMFAPPTTLSTGKGKGKASMVGEVVGPILKRQIGQVGETAVKKYLSEPLIESLTGAKKLADEVARQNSARTQKTQAQQDRQAEAVARKAEADASVAENTARARARADAASAYNSLPTPIPVGMTPDQSRQWFRDNPTATTRTSSNADLFDELRRQGLL